MARVSRKEAAAELGFSRQRLEKLIKQGRIDENADGVDLEQARSVRATMLDLRKEMAEGRGVESTGLPSDEAKPRKVYSVPRGAQKTETKAGELFSFADARTQRERANAQLAELKYLEASGRLIPVDEVKAKEFEVARKLRDRILGFPAKVQSLLPPEAMTIIVTECDQLVMELQEDAARIAERSL